ncbi:mitochondrial fmn-dependent dehydrogenase [Niveomyces insectorum RCEF 264]|uniref:L-lactate dehydrogenase (cytochrome) n=1 Tax=Niveomyces insectorum RCEF 264 TaxID=1081102 RepID=A0A168A8S9_9HYPO|nr:mitochondrial fmn-dependent dehydrogenase [Niveomyces insectorum RCEF 264]
MALTAQDISKHNDQTSCWVIVHGRVYDVTEFLPEHPGGEKIILKYAGRDATAAFDPVHPPDTLDKYLDKSKHLGEVADMAAVAAAERSRARTPEEVAEAAEDAAIAEARAVMPPVESCYNLLDFESVARRVMKRGAWAYYSSAADDEISLRENRTAFQRVWFRPRVLVDVARVDLSTTMLGCRVAAPFYVTATALGRLGHPDGETVLTKAAAAHNVVQMIPTLASCSFDEIVDAAAGPGQPFQWLQLYVNRDREITRRIIQRAESRGCRGLFITVDAPQLGRREKDMRAKATALGDGGSAVQKKVGERTDTSQGAARAISSFIDPGLCWDDLAFFRAVTRMPVVLKGVQRVEDVVRAAETGLVDGVVLSNHGGRQLDFARSSLEVLAETMPVLRAKGLDQRIEVYIDGGVRRATDVLKALCLGAKGVGIGRPFLYAMSAYGVDGVARAMALLKDELEMDMRLLGTPAIKDLGPDLVDTRSLSSHPNGVPKDFLSDGAYDPLQMPAQKSKL